MSAFFEAVGYVVGKAQDVDAVHQLVVAADRARPADQFCYRRRKEINDRCTTAYRSRKTSSQPQLFTVLANLGLELDSSDVCSYLAGCTHGKNGYAQCYHRGKLVESDDLSVAFAHFQNYCASNAIDMNRLIELAP
jgi:hypothetical protein